jgi:hypothetical protein
MVGPKRQSSLAQLNSDISRAVCKDSGLCTLKMASRGPPETSRCLWDPDATEPLGVPSPSVYGRLAPQQPRIEQAAEVPRQQSSPVRRRLLLVGLGDARQFVELVVGMVIS